jgi:hypothetical protein
MMQRLSPDESKKAEPLLALPFYQDQVSANRKGLAFYFHIYYCFANKLFQVDVSCCDRLNALTLISM